MMMSFKHIVGKVEVSAETKGVTARVDDYCLPYMMNSDIELLL